VGEAVPWRRGGLRDSVALRRGRGPDAALY